MRATGAGARYAAMAARLERLPLSVIQLTARVGVGAVFFRSGLLKLSSWQFAVQLFRDEYNVPLLDPLTAARITAAVELGVPVLLFLGLATRLATLPLLGMIAVIQVFRVNPPAQRSAANAPEVKWTDGEVFKGKAEIAAGSELSYPINLNRRATLKAFFTTGKNDKKLGSVLIKAEDFNMWKSGSDVPTFVATGIVPRGTITRVLEPGSYVFVLDNRSGNEPILLSEVEEVIGLGLAARRPGESDAELRERVVDGLIEQRLRFHEVDRSGYHRVPVAEIEARMADIAAAFPDRAAFRRRLGELGMTEEEVRQLVARQLAVLTYVTERLGARVFVGFDDIRAHYQETLVPDLERRGEPVPPLDEVREAVRAVLHEQRLNQELERWTEELRSEADVLVFPAPPEPLPPVVDAF